MIELLLARHVGVRHCIADALESAFFSLCRCSSSVVLCDSRLLPCPCATNLLFCL